MVGRLNATQIRHIVDLAKKGVSIGQLAEATGRRKSTVYYHARDYCRKMTTLNLGLLDETEKGYILGLFLGDGSFNKGFKQRRYVVRFALDAKRDQDIAGRLSAILDKGHKRISVFRTGSTLTAKVCSKELEQYVRVYIDYRSNEEGTNEKTLFVKSNWSLPFAYGILAGIIDSDGHVHEHLGTEVKTVSSSIFKAILRLLAMLGINAKTSIIEPTSIGFSRKPRYVVYIPSGQMKSHHTEIPSVKILRAHSSDRAKARKLN